MNTGFAWLGRLCLAVGLCFSLPVQAADAIGTVKVLEGTVTRSAADQPTALAEGQNVFRNDLIETAPGAAVGITFIDDSTLSLGENAKLVIDELVFEPARGEAMFSANILKGTMAFVSGRIAKLKPENVSVTTPTMTIGVRGTYFVVKVEGGE